MNNLIMIIEQANIIASVQLILLLLELNLLTTIVYIENSSKKKICFTKKK